MKRHPVTKSSAWLGALAVWGLVGAAPSAYATTIGFDLIFSCDFGCTTGIDAPTGMFFVDDSLLLPGTNTALVDTVMVSFMGIDWTFPDPDIIRLAPMIYVDDGAPVALDMELQDTVTSYILRTEGLSWTVGDLPGGPGGILAEEAGGTFLIVRKAAAAIPEPTAATLFTLGAVLTAARVRRMARS